MSRYGGFASALVTTLILALSSVSLSGCDIWTWQDPASDGDMGTSDGDTDTDDTPSDGDTSDGEAGEEDDLAIECTRDEDCVDTISYFCGDGYCELRYPPCTIDYDCWPGQLCDKAGGVCQSEDIIRDVVSQDSVPTCLDPIQGLFWERTPPSEPMTWNEALAYCHGLDINKGKWQLPSISELRSLVRGCVPIETNGACGVKDFWSPCGTDSEESCLAASCLQETDCNPSSCSDDGGKTDAIGLSH